MSLLSFLTMKIRQEQFEDTKGVCVCGGVIRGVNRRTDNTMTKRYSIKGQVMIYKLLHMKLKIE